EIRCRRHRVRKPLLEPDQDLLDRPSARNRRGAYDLFRDRLADPRDRGNLGPVPHDQGPAAGYRREGLRLTVRGQAVGGPRRRLTAPIRTRILGRMRPAIFHSNDMLYDATRIA